MGQCSSIDDYSYPKPIKLEDLVNTPLGGTYESPYGCAPSIIGTQAGSGYQQLINKGFSWPKNNEFTWEGLGSSCSLCSDVGSYGCQCKGGISGQKGVIKRIAYKGDPTNCCTNQNSIDGNSTCDPKYNYNSSICDSSMINFCSQGNNLTNNQNCINWSQKNPDASKKIIVDYCGINNNLSSDYCKSFAYQNVGVMDNSVSKYCQNNTGDTNFCGCYNIPPSLSNIGLKPQCNVKSCLSGTAYKPKSMLNDNSCPTVNLCLQTLNIPSLDQSQITGNIDFSCINTVQTNTPVSNTPLAQATPVASLTPSTPKIQLPQISSISFNFFKDNMVLIIIIIVVLLLSSSGISLLLAF